MTAISATRLRTKQHPDDGGVAPWRQHLVLRLGCQGDKRVTAAPLVGAETLQSIQQ